MKQTLAQLLQNLARRPSWSVDTVPGATSPLLWSGAVHGEVEWYDFSSRSFDDKFTDGFLVRGDTVFAVGELFAAPLLGWGADAAPLLAATDDILWLSCPLKVWERKMGYEAHVIGHLGKAIMPSDRFNEELAVPIAPDSRDDLVRIPVDDGILLARWSEGELLPTGIANADGSPFAIVQSPIRPNRIAFPEPPEGVLSHQDALTLLSRRRRGAVATRKRRKVAATFDLRGPDADDDERWTLFSEDVVTAFGVSGGLEAESTLLQAVAEREPELLDRIEGDSFAESLLIHISDEEAAVRLLAIARSLA